MSRYSILKNNRSLSLRSKKSFTLVELLVAMAIIAILLGLVSFGITIVQRGARDTLRRAKLREFEIVFTSIVSNGKLMPNSIFVVGPNTANIAHIATTGQTIDLPDILNRGNRNGSNYFVDPTDATKTAYCYGQGGGNTIFVIGTQLESGEIIFKTNSGSTFSTFNQTVNGLNCSDNLI